MPSAPAAGANGDPAVLDVLIVGAGLSGIGAAAHLQARCPGKRYAILEGRQAIGGTWDLFRYPCIRSDSDMYTLGYDFKPWTNAKSIADGGDIRQYIRETADEHGITPHIRFGQRAVTAEWSSADACWTLAVEDVASGARHTLRTRFLYMCTGYYSYEEAYRPDFDGEQDFKGQVVLPQFWPEHLDYRGKRVVVIGSGATAVTVVPAMAGTAAHVTMLQRSPTYVISRPAKDGIALRLRRLLPEGAAYALTRWKNVLLTLLFYRWSRARPEQVKRFILKMLRQQLPGYDVDTHFTPSYKPWDQRVCMVPDADMFKAIRDGRVEVVTDHIDRFTAEGIHLKSGRTLAADIIVLATGLKLRLMGGMQVTVDGKAVNPAETMAYKGMMISDVPNFALAFGYTNASWTLKADLTAGYVCRLLNHMDRHGVAIAVPRREADVTPQPFLDFSSGYVQRARGLLPSQGSRKPWQVYQNYLKDLLTIRYGRLDDGAMRFGPRGEMP